MALLKNEPVAPVGSLDELFAIAHLMETEAAERYSELAGRMRAQGNPKLAEVFERLAEEERGHGDAVMALSVRHTGSPPQHAAIRWDPPETMDMAGIDLTDARLLTAYRALSVAVRNEERAFAFWSYVAAQAEAAPVQEAAERMAHSELEHVAMLRRERRRAYHVERREKSTGGLPGTDTLERRLAEECERAAAEAPEQVAKQLRAIAAGANRTAAELAGVRLPMSPSGTQAPAELYANLLPLAEILVDRYLEAADLAEDEGMVAKAQRFAEAAIRRLSWLRENSAGI